MKRWTGQKPDLTHLRSFGERAFVLDKSPGKGKFEPEGMAGFFVGYADQSKAYRFCIPDERKIRISRDFKFLNEFQSHPFKEQVELPGKDAPRRTRSKPLPENRTFTEIVMDASITDPIKYQIQHVEALVNARNNQDNLEPFHGFERQPQLEQPRPGEFLPEDSDIEEKN